jgi:hypothetical protein
MCDNCPDDDLDRLGRDAVRTMGGAPAALVDVLDEWLLTQHGMTSGAHCVGAFLDLLAAEGYQVTPTPPAEFADLLPPSPD